MEKLNYVSYLMQSEKTLFLTLLLLLADSFVLSQIDRIDSGITCCVTDSSSISKSLLLSSSQSTSSSSESLSSTSIEIELPPVNK